MYLTIGLTIAARADSRVEGYSGVAFTTLQFFYVIELLRDIDDPFVSGPLHSRPPHFTHAHTTHIAHTRSRTTPRSTMLASCCPL